MCYDITQTHLNFDTNSPTNGVIISIIQNIHLYKVTEWFPDYSIDHGFRATFKFNSLTEQGPYQMANMDELLVMFFFRLKT